jgi:predicted MFS family arabinose efflux permease
MTIFILSSIVIMQTAICICACFGWSVATIILSGLNAAFWIVVAILMPKDKTDEEPAPPPNDTGQGDDPFDDIFKP